MKFNLKSIVALALMATAVAFTGCGKEDPPTDDPANEGITNVGTHYAFLYQNRPIEPLDTLVYNVTALDRENGKSDIILFIENITSGVLTSTQDVSMLEGPASLAKPEVCGNGDCPWDGNPYDIAPGICPDPLAIGIINPASIAEGTKVLYRVAVGENPDFANATVIYLCLNF